MTVLELRQYTLHAGKRDTLIELFDRYFLEGQEECGMDILGQFRDLDAPNCFVWLRGFADMEARKEALAKFYSGPVWAAHRAAANATMIDSSDVLLLKPAWDRSGFKLDRNDRPAIGSVERAGGEILARVTRVAVRELTGFSNRFREEQASGRSLIAAYVTETSENTYPALPVRDDSVFVSFHDGSQHDGAMVEAPPIDRPACSSEWLRLAPTAWSLLRGPR